MNVSEYFLPRSLVKADFSACVLKAVLSSLSFWMFQALNRIAFSILFFNHGVHLGGKGHFSLLFCKFFLKVSVEILTIKSNA